MPRGLVVGLLAGFLPSRVLRELPGATIVTGGLVALLTGLSQAPAWGWTATTTLALLATGVALLVGFVAVESRAEHPLVPMGLLRVRTAAAGNAIMVLTGAALLGLFYFLSLYEQVILHYGAITAGLSQLPFALALIAAADAAAPLIARRGSKTVLSAGLVLLAGGLVWFGRNHNGLSINGQATWPPNLVPLIYPGAGIGITIS